MATLVPVIRRLTIDRFRGIEKLVWYPELGVNVLLGGGDVGKTTVLDAIALLLSPTNTTAISDADYWRRQVENGFCIEAVMSVPESCGINQQTKNAWPWEWNGSEPVLPAVDKDPAAAAVVDPVYRLRVRGTSDFDVVYEVFQPDGTADHLSAGVRRGIGLVRLGGDDRNDRDLRLIQGSALERLLSDKTLRARLGQKLGASDVEEELKDDAKSRLKALDKAFEQQALPTGLGLGLTSGQGLSLNALIGLTATEDKVRLPLASWGAGTRRLAALEIAEAHQGENPITLVDELERGLEPYRQRVLMNQLQNVDSQVFVTTHSAAALSAASKASLWYMDPTPTIGRLPTSVNLHRQRDPETFLARVAVIAEGPTEVGFVGFLLRRAVGDDLLERGVWITDGCGNAHTLTLLESFVRSGLRCAAFADNEGTEPGKWSAVQKELGSLLFRWPTGNLEENVMKFIPADRFEELITDPEDERTGERLRTLADRLGIADKGFANIKANATNLRQLIIEAATGVVPDQKKNADKGEKKALKRHAEKWFKSVDGGRELAAKVFEFGLWPQLEKDLLPFLNSVRKALSLQPLASLLPS